MGEWGGVLAGGKRYFGLVTNRRAGICFLRLTEVPPCLTEVPQPQPWLVPLFEL